MVSCEAAMHCDTMPQPATHDADRHATMTSSAAAVLTLQSLLRTEASEQMPCRVGCRRCRAAHAVLTHTSNTNAMPEGPADHGGDVVGHSRRASKTIRARCTLCLALRKERHLRIISDLRGDRTSHQVKHDICHSHVQEWIEVEEEVPKRKKKKKSKKKKKAAEAADATSADEPPADIDGSATPAEPVAAGA